MQQRVQVISLLVLVSLFSGCWKKSEEAKSAVASENNGVKLINVLDQNYFVDAHIPSSLNVSLDDLEKESEGWNKNADVVVYCANYKCSASAAAARKLMTLGFAKVHAYEAGMAGWAQAGLPVEGPAEEGYLTQGNEKPEKMAHDHDEDDHDEDKAVEAHDEVVEISTDELASLLGVQKANS